VISGLENFTFIDTPKEEFDILRSLKKYTNQFNEEHKHQSAPREGAAAVGGENREKSPLNKPF
jgi:hypothetical protein